jgi:hypothetical protein
MLFFPRRVRLVCFFIVTPWEIGVILTANYTFLNYLVLVLGFLLLDDKFLLRFVPARFKPNEPEPVVEPEPEQHDDAPLSIFAVSEESASAAEASIENASGAPDLDSETRDSANLDSPSGASSIARLWRKVWEHKPFSVARMILAAVLLTWVAYNTTAELIGIPLGRIPLPTAPIAALAPFRIANQYGLFAVMTRGRYEIEFQGSDDGQNWISYSFRYKPQALDEAPGIYAPYQPRFDWNLWFASLSDWRQNQIVPLTEEHLLTNGASVLSLFRDNPFPRVPPRYVRAVLWQYWFTTLDEKRSTGEWWRREYLGLYAPELTPTPDGQFVVVQWPGELPPHD